MNEILNEFKESKEFLIKFIKQPFHEIKNIPDWSWRRLLILQVCFTSISGALSGLFSQSKLTMFVQMFTMPILTLTMLSLTCLLFYYFYQIFSNQALSFRQLFATVLFANIPFFIFNIISSYVSPILLVGFAFTAFLLIVGLVDRHRLPKKMTVRLILGLYLMVFILWVVGRIDGSRFDKTWQSPKIEAPEVKLGE
jgi:hypothetical protein